MAHLARLTVYPVKSLDGVDLETVSVTDGGALSGDREYVLVDHDGDPITAKRTARIHDLTTDFDPETHELTVSTDGTTRQFDLATDRTAAETWFSDFFDRDVTVKRDPSVGFPDLPDAGPSVISTATLQTVSDWFDGLSVEELRRRMRANVEVDGVPPFWEDRFSDGRAFEVGGVRFDGVKSCERCVVPVRNPETGEPTPDFRERFVERRAATYPEWVDPESVPHDYTLMLIANVPPDDRGKQLTVGDDISVL